MFSDALSVCQSIICSIHTYMWFKVMYEFSDFFIINVGMYVS